MNCAYLVCSHTSVLELKGYVYQFVFAEKIEYLTSFLMHRESAWCCLNLNRSMSGKSGLFGGYSTSSLILEKSFQLQGCCGLLGKQNTIQSSGNKT